MTTLLEPLPSHPDLDDCRLAPPVDWAPLITPKSQRQLRALIFVSVASAIWYLSWLLQAARVGNPWLYGAMIVAELFNAVQALGFWWTVNGRKKGGVSRERAAMPPGTEVDVFIPTYSEPVSVVEATVASAVALTGAQVRVWLLDDGDRSEMADLAVRYGTGYITREEHLGAKAGNINHGLGLTKAPYVLVLDCDHVPLSHFLEATLPDFHDAHVAFVQTPQYYANSEQSPIAAASWSQQAIFFGSIAQGKDRHDTMFCCGTNVVFRREALESVGGFPTNSLTEDFELSVRLHENGWKTTYVAETLACGLGPEDMASYVGQQHRWARGCLSAIPRILSAKLPLRQRLQYLLSSAYFLSGFTVCIYMLLPILQLTVGVQPLAKTTADQFLLHFAPYYVLSLYTLTRAGFGSFSFKAFALASANFWIHMHAFYRLITRRPSKFVVTPKQGSSARQPRAVAPALMFISALLAAGVWGIVTRGMTPSTMNNLAFVFLHVAVLSAGIWPALVKGQGKKGNELVTDLTESGRPHLVLVPVLAIETQACTQ